MELTNLSGFKVPWVILISSQVGVVPLGTIFDRVHIATGWGSLALRIMYLFLLSHCQGLLSSTAQVHHIAQCVAHGTYLTQH